MICKNGFSSAVHIHCGGNDIGDIPCGLFLHLIRVTFATLLIDLILGVPIIGHIFSEECHCILCYVLQKWNAQGGE